MNPPSAARDGPELARFMTAFSRDAVRMQEIWDEAHARDLERCAEVLARGGAAAPAPRRLHLVRSELSTRAHFTVDRSRGGALRLTPLNLGFELRYGSATARESVLRLEVERVADPPSPSKTPT